VPRRERRLDASLARVSTQCAASLGRVHMPSVHDVGMQIALWVNAIEILAWPISGHANLGYVIDLLGNFAWGDDELDDRPHAIRVGKTERAVNPVQYAYSALNSVRNAFLHGEPVEETSLKSTAIPDANIFLLPAIVYRTALAVILGINPQAPYENNGLSPGAAADFSSHALQAQALAVQLGLPARDLSDYFPKPPGHA
jgi:hypothetical protein